MTPIPTGTVTFLFTDIEGSTKLAQEHPVAWESARQRHHAILRAAVEAHRGYVFQIIGDAFCSAFPNASDGLQAALAAQRALQAVVWGEAPVRVRMGLHTGAAEANCGDYQGYLTLAQVQRVMSAGHGGQVLLSQTTYDLLHGRLPSDVSICDLGAQRLKDFPEPEHLYQVVMVGLPSEFPPLRTLDALPNNLPVQPTSFIGRKSEIAAIKQRLSETHLLTLTGVGGTGKTRLALRAAADLLGNFEHGVWLVELATLADPHLVPQTVASALQLRDQAGRAPLAAVTDFLQARELLLLLDNCEHLIGASAQLADHLLRRCSKLRILATSREPLGIAGEVIWSVPSLSLPQDNSQDSPDRLEQYEAVKLFTERARAVQASFVLNASNARAVAQICTRLDGIPLALELAAARVRGMGVEQIADRLNHRFRLLTGGSRTALPRQQTLSALIDWSYDLLSDSERLLFRRLPVFAGLFTLEAAEVVCVDEVVAHPSTPLGSTQDATPFLETSAILDLLLRLVDKSLVITEEREGESYYRLLETIRQYAREKLLGAGEAERLGERHAQTFLRLAEVADHELRGPNQLEWLCRLAVLRDNLRAALDWLIDTRQTEEALRMARKLDWFWFVRSDHSEGRQWLERVLALEDAPQHPESYADALTQLAHHTWLQRGEAEARPPVEQALAVARAQGHQWITAKALAVLGLILTNERNFEAAQAALDESKVLFRQVHDDWGYAHAVMCLTLLPYRQGDLAAALVLYEQTLELFRALGDRFFQGVALRFIGAIRIQQGDWVHALAPLREALSLSQQLNSKFEIAAELWGFARYMQMAGNAARAVRLHWAARKAFESIGAMTAEVRIAFEHDLAMCRVALDEPAFAAAVAEGRALTLDQSIELALDETLT